MVSIVFDQSFGEKLIFINRILSTRESLAMRARERVCTFLQNDI